MYENTHILRPKNGAQWTVRVHSFTSVQLNNIFGTIFVQIYQFCHSKPFFWGGKNFSIFWLIFVTMSRSNSSVLRKRGFPKFNKRYLTVVKRQNSSMPGSWSFSATQKSDKFLLLVKMHNSPFSNCVLSQALKFGSTGPIQCLTYGLCHYYPPPAYIHLLHSNV